jgi:hypothetical protein
MVLEGLGLRTDAELLLVRTDRDGLLEHVALSRGTLLETGDTRIKTEGPTSFLEISFDGKTDERPSP